MRLTRRSYKRLKSHATWSQIRDRLEQFVIHDSIMEKQAKEEGYENFNGQWVKDEKGRRAKIKTVAGQLFTKAVPKPPPNSWAADENSHIAVWTILLEPHASITLPSVPQGVNRSLYFYRGEEMAVGGNKLQEGHRANTSSQSAIVLQAGNKPAELLLLQGRPIGEPVVKYGPFVMTSRQEIQNAFRDLKKSSRR